MASNKEPFIFLFCHHYWNTQWNRALKKGKICDLSSWFKSGINHTGYYD